MSVTASSGPAHRPARLLRPRTLAVLGLGLALLLLLAVIALALRIRSEHLTVRPATAAELVTASDDVEEVTFPTGRGELPALEVPGRSTTWFVLVHDVGQRPDDLLGWADEARAAGMTTLAISYRNDPGVAADPSKQYAYGRTEWRDLEAAVLHARDQGAERVVLGGVGMGGSIVAAYLETAERESGLVRGVVLATPVLDLASVADADLAGLDLPFGTGVPRPVAAVARMASSRLDGVDWGAVDYVDDTSWLRVPTLVLHGADDPVVPVTASEELAAAEPDLVDLTEVDGTAGPDAAFVRDEVGRFLRTLR